MFFYASDKAVVALDGASGRVVGTRAGKARVNALCAATTATEDGEKGMGGVVVVCGCADKVLRVFDPREMAFVGRVMSGGHRHEVTATCAHGDGRAASGCRDGTVAIWRLASDGSGALESTHRGCDGPITVLASTGDVIAVGGANGTVCALDPRTGASHRVAASGYGEVTSLSWTHARTSEGTTKELLAVGSRERRVTVWKLEDGKLVNTHALLLPKPATALSEAQRGRVWVAVAWAGAMDDKSVQLVTSGQGGDLLSWSVPLKFGEGVEEVKVAKTFGPRDVAHARTVFTIATRDDTCWSTSLDRKVACWDLDTAEQRWSFTALGGYVYDLSTDVQDPFSVAIACGDGTVHGWDLSPTLSGAIGSTLLWKGIPSTKVTCIARKPKSDIVAFGLDDGRVGCFDATSGKFACYPECHGASVNEIRWFEIRSADEVEGQVTLTSLGADGSLWRWMETFDPATCDTKKSGIADARKFGKYIDMARICKSEGTKDSQHIETFDYSPIQGLLACGWSGGEVSVHAFSEVKWRRQEHTQSACRVRWHPGCDDESSQYSSWLATSSTSGSVIVHGIDGVVLCALPRAMVHDIAWSPRKDVAVLACAQHSNVKVWSIDSVASEFYPTNLAILRGHCGKVMCVKFSHHDHETIMSGGDDKTFRVWRYTEEEHVPQDSEDTSTNKITPTAADVEVVEKLSEKVSNPKKTTAKTRSKPTGISGPLFKPSSIENTAEGIAEGREATLALARRIYDGQECELDSLPSAALTYGPAGTALYEDSDAAMALLLNEAQRVSDDVDSSKDLQRSVALHVYRGDYAHAASILLKANDAPISSDMMSLFIGGGYDVWSAVAVAQCDRLVAAGEHQQAALLRLSLHDVRGAVQTLKQGGFIRDAAALAAARLLPTDELVVETRRELAAAEETRGGMEAAAKAHLSLGNTTAAVRALTRSDVGGAFTAAKVALVCKLTGPEERRTVLRAAVELAESGDVAAAADMLADLRNLLRNDGLDVDITTAILGMASAPDVADELVRRFEAVTL